jgi:histidine ammonia-lyase
MGMAQAVDLRGKEMCSPFLQKNYDTIRGKVEKLMEDRRMDVDIKVVNEMIKDKKFV